MFKLPQTRKLSEIETSLGVFRAATNIGNVGKSGRFKVVRENLDRSGRIAP